MKKVLAVISLFIPLCSLAQSEHVYQYELIEGNNIAWSCEGQGSPTIALIAGGGLDAHSSFSRIYHNYDGPGRICLYERAGMGESSFVAPRIRSLSELVDELHQVITKAEWGEMLVVAHSFGGFIARAYASEHPENVLGMLLLDVAQEDWAPGLQKTMSPDDWAIMERILNWSTATFNEDYIEAQEAVRNTALRQDLPITVVSRGLAHTQIRLEKMSYDGIDKFNAEHNATQLKLLDLTSDTQHKIAKVSSHMIDNYDPWLVIEEIKSLLERIDRKGE